MNVKIKGKSTAGLEGKKVKAEKIYDDGSSVKVKEKYGRKLTGKGKAFDNDWWAGRQKKKKTTIRKDGMVVKIKEKGGKKIIKTRKQGSIFGRRRRVS